VTTHDRQAGGRTPPHVVDNMYAVSFDCAWLHPPVVIPLSHVTVSTLTVGDVEVLVSREDEPLVDQVITIKLVHTGTRQAID
jgi:hypothetical protein